MSFNISKFQMQGIVTLRYSKLLFCSQLLSRQWIIKNEISKSVGKTKHKEMSGNLLVIMTNRSNIMVSTSYVLVLLKVPRENMVSQKNGIRNHKSAKHVESFW